MDIYCLINIFSCRKITLELH